MNAATTPARSEIDKTLVDVCARELRAGFADYHARFSALTKRAQRRFETRDWEGAQNDTSERIKLYDDCIGEMVGRIERMLGAAPSDRVFWGAVLGAMVGVVAFMVVDGIRNL